jgi:hypothetical protein
MTRTFAQSSAGLCELNSDSGRGAGPGAMDYLRGFPTTAPLVRMILVITRDVGPFLGVCLIVIVGCTCFFAINSPEADSAFGNFDGVVGFLHPLLTVCRLL